MGFLELINRDLALLNKDIVKHENELRNAVSRSTFLVIGGAGSIGQAVTKEIFKRNPQKLHIVDISENNLVELVRDIRSSFGYLEGDFKTFALDCGSIEFEAMFNASGPYDYVLNLSALKHVRSEKDPFTLMRMIQVNILNTVKTIDLAVQSGVKKYFCVSTDKAANPANLMGASKRIMEMFLVDKGHDISISTARFANVAFSDGSLLHGFRQRLIKKQPIAAPNDVKRYFVTPEEAGQLCLMSTILGENGDIFFPEQDEDLKLITFSGIAERFLRENGYEPYYCETENEAREKIDSLIPEKKWPCLFSGSDTTGEKPFEEFYTENELVDHRRFINLGIVKNSHISDTVLLKSFLHRIELMKSDGKWSKDDLVSLIRELLPSLDHEEKGKNLDQKM